MDIESYWPIGDIVPYLIGFGVLGLCVGVAFLIGIWVGRVIERRREIPKGQLEGPEPPKEPKHPGWL